MIYIIAAAERRYETIADIPPGHTLPDSIKDYPRYGTAIQWAYQYAYCFLIVPSDVKNPIAYLREEASTTLDNLHHTVMMQFIARSADGDDNQASSIPFNPVGERGKDPSNPITLHAYEAEYVVLQEMVIEAMRATVAYLAVLSSTP